MADIEFPVNLGDRIVTASILDPASEHTDPDGSRCPRCGQEAYFSGCDVPDCNGWGCPDCGTGCDLDFLDEDDGGRCACALADRSGDAGECEGYSDDSPDAE